MTENEAKAVRYIENIKNHATVTLDHIAKEEPNVSPLVYKGREEKANTILVMVEELKQYRAIGSVEECQVAMEKQTEKKVENSREHIPFEWYCPTCGNILCDDGWKDTEIAFCEECGQAIDWNEDNEDTD